MSPPNRSEIMSIEDTDPAEGAAQEPPLRDEPGQRPLAGRRTLHEGMVFDLVRDTVDFADGVRFDREYIWHTGAVAVLAIDDADRDRKSTRLNSSHVAISYAVFCLKHKKDTIE